MVEINRFLSYTKKATIIWAVLTILFVLGVRLSSAANFPNQITVDGWSENTSFKYEYCMGHGYTGEISKLGVVLDSDNFNEACPVRIDIYESTSTDNSCGNMSTQKGIYSNNIYVPVTDGNLFAVSAEATYWNTYNGGTTTLDPSKEYNLVLLVGYAPPSCASPQSYTIQPHGLLTGTSTISADINPYRLFTGTGDDIFLTLPVNGLVTPDFTQWHVIASMYSGITGSSTYFGVQVATSTDRLKFDTPDLLQVYDETYLDYDITIPKTPLYVTATTTYYAQAFIYRNGTSEAFKIASSSVITFYVVGGSTCLDAGCHNEISGASIFSAFGTLIDQLLSRPPIGYAYVYIRDFENNLVLGTIDTEYTNASWGFSILGSILAGLRAIITILFWALFGIYLIKRVGHIQT